MSLYFDECVKEEQIAGDSDKDKIVFTFPWIIDIQPIPEVFENWKFNKEISVSTYYNLYSAKWNLCLTNDNFRIRCYDQEPMKYWEESSFCISYKLYSDNEMRNEIYSSERIALETSWLTWLLNSVNTPVGSIKQFSNALKQRKLAKVVIFVEFTFLKKYFICPLDIWWLNYGKNSCDKLPDIWPDDTDSDFRFEFLKESDFIFKCPDGNVPAIKMVINVSCSSFLKEQLKKQSTGMELIVNHLSDVVKPLITFIHSECFEMPKEYDLDFADRLLKALKFFELEKEQYLKIRRAIARSLFLKFINEPHDFELILQWISLGNRHYLYFPFMASAVIANKYYYKWLERFPENERNAENIMLQNLFGSADRALQFFERVEDNFLSLFFINTIMP